MKRKSYVSIPEYEATKQKWINEENDRKKFLQSISKTEKEQAETYWFVFK